ncbi:MAG TPA: hypothetical protein VKV77_05490 [Methylovirgula sp.]|nr:hypothetical protein [Methylovirgula sp.]
MASNKLLSDRQLFELIEQTVRELFEQPAFVRKIGMQESEIESVSVERGEDFDDQDIISIDIVLSDAARLPDVGKTILPGLATRIREKLAEVNEYSFPLVRMMSKADSEHLHQ